MFDECSLLSATGPIIIQVRGTGTRVRLAETEPSLIQTAETPGHQGARGKESGILKRKGSNNRDTEDDHRGECHKL